MKQMPNNNKCLMLVKFKAQNLHSISTCCGTVSWWLCEDS